MHRFFTAIALVLLLGIAHPATAAGAATKLTPTDLSDFFDPFLTRQLQEKQIPGAVVAVVKDGQLLFSRGYGYANLEQQTPVDPARTLYNIGSVTKLFTATAVMQQVEQGKLDLKADVNRYLSAFKVPATFPGRTRPPRTPEISPSRYAR